MMYSTVERMIDHLPDEALRAISRGVCPDCKNDAALLDGPRGGVAQNIACMVCGAEFNIVECGSAVILAHRNSEPGKPNHTRLREVYGIVLPGNARHE
jgi:hypothetical protein